MTGKKFLRIIIFKIFICIVLFAGVIKSNNGHEPKESPRKLLMDYLYDQGCTERILCAQIIEAEAVGLSAANLVDRLKYITSESTTNVNKW
jgi:hypothetical protein